MWQQATFQAIMHCSNKHCVCMQSSCKTMRQQTTLKLQAIADADTYIALAIAGYELCPSVSPVMNLKG